MNISHATFKKTFVSCKYQGKEESPSSLVLNKMSQPNKINLKAVLHPRLYTKAKLHYKAHALYTAHSHCW